MAFKEDIMKELGINDEKLIPKVTGTYRVKPGILQVHPMDMPTFQALFAAGTNKGVGNGEVSLFWLFNWGRRSNRAKETRGGNDPDLHRGLELTVEQFSRNRAIVSHKLISESSIGSKKMLFD